MSEAVLTIEQLNTAYLVAREHPAPDQVRQDLDFELRSTLPELCGGLLGNLLDPGDPAVWIIRRLDLDFALCLDRAQSWRAPRVIAQQMASSIARTIAAGSDGDVVIRFPNRAAFLARFLHDLARGRAWGEWCYARFETLRSLPLSAALREAILGAPDLAEPALVHLSVEGQFGAVSAALSERDCERVFANCFEAPAGTGLPDTAAIQIALEAWNRSIPPSERALPSGRSLLRTFVAARRAAPAAEGPPIAHSLRMLEGLAIMRAVSRDPDAPRQWIELGNRETSRDYDPVLDPRTEFVTRFWSQVAREGRGLFEEAARSVGVPAALQQAAPAGSRTAWTGILSDFAGLSLLIPSIIDLGLHELSHPSTDNGESLDGALRAVLLAKCLGGARARTALSDAGFRLLCGSTGVSAPEELEQVCAGIKPQSCRALQSEVVKRLVDRFIVDGAILYAEVVLSDPPTIVIRDSASDAWVFGALLSEPRTAADALREGVESVQSATGVPVDLLILGQGFAPFRGSDDDLQGLPPTLWWRTGDRGERLELPVRGGESRPILSAEDMNAVAADVRPRLADSLRRMRPIGQDLDYLALGPRGIRVSPDFDLAWSMAAHAVMRGFARRLIGFERSSSSFLYENFLAGTGTVRHVEGGITVRLPRCPLEMLLRLAGVHGQVIVPSWLGGVEVTLELEGG